MYHSDDNGDELILTDPLELLMSSVLDAGLTGRKLRDTGKAVGNRMFAVSGQDLIDSADRGLAALAHLHGIDNKLEQLIDDRKAKEQ